MAKNPPNNRSFIKAKGEPPPLSLDLIEKIANVIRHGNYIETAVAMYGVPRADYYFWCDKARHSDDPKCLERVLLDTVEKALAEAEVRDLQRIDQAADGREVEFLRDEETNKIIFNDKGDPIIKKPGMQPQWAAAAWKLERRSPKRWGRTDRLELSGKDGGPVKVHEMTEEELKAEEARLQKILDDEGA